MYDFPERSMLDTKLKALADPTRREILSLLKTKPRTAGEIAAHFFDFGSSCFTAFIRLKKLPDDCQDTSRTACLVPLGAERAGRYCTMAARVCIGIVKESGGLEKSGPPLLCAACRSWNCRRIFQHPGIHSAETKKVCQIYVRRHDAGWNVKADNPKNYRRSLCAGVPAFSLWAAGPGWLAGGMSA